MSSYTDPNDPDRPTQPVDPPPEDPRPPTPTSQEDPRPPTEGAAPGYEYTAPPPPAPPPASPGPGYQYAAPAPAAGGPPQEALAGFWIRFGGLVIDGIILAVVSSILEAILGIDRSFSQPSGAVSWVQFILAGAYFTYFHATAAGQTIGNRALGIRVLDADSGGPLTYARSFIRFLVSYVSGLVILLGFLWMLWDNRNQTWHDKAANSLVVRAKAYPPGPFGRPAS